MEARKKSQWFDLMICFAVLVTIAGCAKRIQTSAMTVVPPKPKQQEAVKIPPPPVQEKPKAASVPPPSAQLEDVFFAFDRYILNPDDQKKLNEDAQWLKENATATVLIEGHCDERGTAEYNLVLGENRASAARKYLESVGVDSNRIKTISYGREKPFCTAHNERCWQQNRRDHFINKMRQGEGS